MASGTIVGTTSKHHTCVVKWSSSKGNGGSKVTATVYNRVTGTWRYSAGKACSVTINGSTTSGTLPRVWNTTGDFKGATRTQWIAYTGNKSITISGKTDLSSVTYVSDGSKVGVRTCSQRVALDKVGEKPPSVSFTSPTTHVVSEKGATITLSWGKCNDYSGAAKYGIQVSINGGGWARWKYGIANATTSANYTIPAGQGNSYRFAIECYNDVGSSAFSYSGTVTTNKITAPDIGTLDVFNPYVNPTYTIPLSGGSQLNGETFKRRADVYVDDTLTWSGSTPADDNTSVSITMNGDDVANKLGASSYSSTNRFYVVAWCENSNGTKSSTVKSYFTVDLNTDGGAVPTLEEPILSGGILDNPSTCFIAGYTPVTVTSGTASLRRAPSSATLTYMISCTGLYSVGGSSATFEMFSAGERTATVTVRDSRGLSASVSKKFMVQSYSPPTIKTISASRLDSPNTSGKVEYVLTYTPIYQYTSPTVKGNQLNGINVQQITKDGGTTWYNYSTGTEIQGLNTELSYTVALRISDNAYPTSYITKNTYIPTIISQLSLRSDRIGIMCVPQEGFALDVNGNARFNSPIASSLNTSSYVNGSSGRAIINSTNYAGGYTTFLKGNSTNGAFTLSTYKDNIFIGYQSKDTIDAGTNSLTKSIYLLAEDGSTSLNNLKVTGEIHVGSTFGAGEGTIKGVEIGSDGHMELSGATPYIDFHYNNSSDDYTVKIQAKSDGLNFISAYDTYKFVFNNDIDAPNLKDSGWIDLPLSSNFISYSNDQKPKYRRIGKMVEITGAVKPTKDLTFSSASSHYTIANIPDEILPNRNIYILCQGSSANIWLFDVLKEGTLIMERHRNGGGSYVNATTSNWFPFHVTFYVD